MNSLGRNPYPEALVKFVMQLLPKDIVQKHWTILERVSDSVRHENDYRRVAMMLIEIYQAGFILSTNQHKALLKTKGIDVSIISPVETPKIFKTD